MATPTETVTTTTNIPKYAEPAFTRLLGRAEAYADTPYQFYQGQRFADINPLQRQYMESATNLLPSWQTGAGSNLAAEAGLRALDTGAFGNQQAQQYMSPYIQQVLNVQRQNAMRDYERQLPGLQAQGAKFGAIGGSRAALARSEAMRNLQNSLQGIDATGLQNAYQQAMAQYNADQTRRMQGLNTAMQGASTLGTLGQSEYAQRLDTMNAQRTAGQDLYNLAQQQKDFDYQQFTEAQNLPYMQMGFVSDVLRGAPANDATRTVYGRGPNTAAQVAGFGVGVGGLYNAMKGG